MTTRMLGLDIGGANLKAVYLSGACRSVPFALWRSPGELAPRLGELVASLPPADALAVTMTGELCDCFACKRDGVEHILTAVESVAGGRAVHVWLTTGRFADPADVRRSPLLAAASNWLALATWAGRLAASGPALLIDIGSTTADLVPLEDGRPTPLGRSDPERLKCRELVYTGVRRTPVCALLGEDGAAEWFATTQDVYLVLGESAEAPGDCDTADGRP